jgi:hypothetical protein
METDVCFQRDFGGALGFGATPALLIVDPANGFLDLEMFGVGRDHGPDPRPAGIRPAPPSADHLQPHRLSRRRRGRRHLVPEGTAPA